MASVKVKSGGSLKSRKGNRFEYDTAYSLEQAGYNMTRIDDNSQGLDLIGNIIDKRGAKSWIYIECKNRQKLSWNELKKIHEKLVKISSGHSGCGTSYVVFKSNHQPTLVFWKPAALDYIISTFNDVFYCDWKKRPKGYKLWK